MPQPQATAEITNDNAGRYAVSRASDDPTLTATAHRLLEKLALADPGPRERPTWRAYDPAQLAQLLNVHIETLRDAVRRLARSGYVEKRPAPSRRHRAQIRLTPAPVTERQAAERARERGGHE